MLQCLLFFFFWVVQSARRKNFNCLAVFIIKVTPNPQPFKYLCKKRPIFEVKIHLAALRNSTLKRVKDVIQECDQEYLINDRVVLRKQ